MLAVGNEQLLKSETGFWLLLSCLPKFGGRRQQAVIEGIGELGKLLTSNAATLRALGLQADTISAIEAWQTGNISHPLVTRALAIYRDCQHYHIDLMTRADSDYPSCLRHIHDAPLVLYL
jgi:DNA processing protein